MSHTFIQLPYIESIYQTGENVYPVLLFKAHAK